jgi:hypothetical protein
MTSTHLISCFIRKNNSELIHYLQKLGYKNNKCSLKDGDCIHTLRYIDNFDGTIEDQYIICKQSILSSINHNMPFFIDCQDDENLFKLLVNYNNKTDKGKMYICIKEDDIVNAGNSIIFRGNKMLDFSHYREATLEEIINYYNKLKYE